MFITLHGPDDGSVEPKRYSVDFSINLSFHLDYLVINFSTWYINDSLFMFVLSIYYSLFISISIGIFWLDVSAALFVGYLSYSPKTSHSADILLLLPFYHTCKRSMTVNDIASKWIQEYQVQQLHISHFFFLYQTEDIV